MLHTQITRLIKHKVVFYSKNSEHMLFSFFSRHPLWFMNSTKHVTHSTLTSTVNLTSAKKQRLLKNLG